MDNKRNTVQRQLILDTVKKLNMHVTADQVYEHIHKIHPTISKATVYRNLSQMSESGELINIGNFYGSAHYDHKCHEHYHFICEDCRQIFDIEGGLSDFIDKMNGLDGFDIKNYNLSFTGLCRDCNTKK